MLEFLKARIHCEIYLSDCFMKHNLTHISLHLIWFSFHLKLIWNSYKICKKETSTNHHTFYFYVYISFKFLQTSLTIKELIKHENNRETIEKILKIDFQNFDVSWNVSKSISWTFLGSLHDETIVKYVFHEMLWKKYFTVYPRLYRR